MAFPLTDLPTLKTLLGVNGEKEDAHLARLIDVVSSQVARLANMVDAVEQVARTETKDVRPGQRWFKLRAKPAVSVSLVEFDLLGDYTSPSTIDAANFILKPETAELFLHFDLVPRGSRRMVAPQALRATYIGGVGATLEDIRDSIPELEHYTIVWIQTLWKRKRTSPQRISISGQGGSVTLEEMDIPAEVRKGLRRLRRVNVG